ncbi:MAG: four helix bundle protein [Caldilineales bacterium]|nr:four helix bundle protein [Caldilineales bacterium]
MAGIRRFEEIHAWQEARELTKQMYALCADGSLARDFGLRDQMQRAAVSTMTNIAEGFGNSSNVEFARFLEIARRSALEVQSLLYVAVDVGHISETNFRTIYQQAEKTKAMIGGFRRFVLDNHNPSL